MSEPIYLVIERGADGREIACLYYDRIFGRATKRVYTLRIDKLSPDQQQFWLSKPLPELLDVYRWLRDEGTLSPSNLADAPREKPRQGRQLGNWWTPPALPRGQDWSPDYNPQGEGADVKLIGFSDG